MSNVINIDDIFNSSSIKKIQKIKAIDLLGRSICECETQENLEATTENQDRWK